MGNQKRSKGGAIRRITEYITPRHFRIVALNIPTEDERKQWFFQRYINQLPKPGEIVLFDRMLVHANIHLIKLYFSITKEEQAARFEEIKSNPLKRWKMTPTDEKAQELWEEYTTYKKRMFKDTNSAHAPWHIIDADKKPKARLAAIIHLLSVIPYE